MGIYIKGIEMPKGYLPIQIQIWPDGQVDALNHGEYWSVAKAIHVPPHGDLIDRDVLMDSDGDVWDGMWGYSGVQIANAPTIIQADDEHNG